MTLFVNYCVIERTFNVLKICQLSCVTVIPIPVLLCRTFPIQNICVHLKIFLKSLFAPQIPCDGLSDGREDLPGSCQREK